MMKATFLFFFLLVSGALMAQDVSLQHGESYKAEHVNSFLHDLYKVNDYVISFRVRYTDRNDEPSDYFILTKKDAQISVYNYLKKAARIEPLKLSAKSTEFLWKTFVQNDLFSMQDEKDIANFCLGKYQIYNSYTYEFVLLSKGAMKTLSYYDPEYYDNACYGMAERKKIINCVSAITYVLNK